MSDTGVLESAREFLLVHGRLLERRAFEHLFDGVPADGVRDAVSAYTNPDGGFGHALEPDLRCATSQPIHMATALDAMIECAVDAPDLVRAACDWLETVSTPEGTVAPALPGASDSPCADHWELEWAVTPAVNPTAGLAARLHCLGVGHPWRERATAWSVEQIRSETFASAHALKEALLLAEHHPDRDVAGALRERLVPQLDAAEWFQLEPPVTTYTQTPLHFAPGPDAFLSGLFDDAVIHAHLDDLLANQRDDGGWPVYWTAPGATAEFEWRGRWTLDALKTLRAYGRV